MIAVWTPWTVVPRSSAMLLIATFMFEPAKLATNWVSASGTSTRPVVAAALTAGTLGLAARARVIQIG